MCERRPNRVVAEKPASNGADPCGGGERDRLNHNKLQQKESQRSDVPRDTVEQQTSASTEARQEGPSRESLAVLLEDRRL